MPATSEILSVLVRVGKEHHKLGDDFTGVCTLANLYDGGCFVAGFVDADYDDENRDAILDLAAGPPFNFTYAKFKRVLTDKEGKPRVLWFKYDLTRKPYLRSRA